MIVNEYKNARQNLDDDHKAVLPRMWSTEHATNYMEFTGPLEFTIKPEFQSEERLISAINEFRTQFSRGERDMEDYHNFLRQFSDYINVEKPSFSSNIATGS